ncbi:MAG TPA: ABC transporter substrate-binding protein [Thermaerobacter sp.]
MPAYRWWKVALAVLAAGAFLAGWMLWKGSATNGQRPPGRLGGVWVESLAHAPSTLDPARALGEADVRVASLVYDGLVRLDPDGRVVPALARSWRVADGGRLYVFWLRPGVRFHNGRPLTADDVVFSLTRLADPRQPAPRAWVLYGVRGVDEYLRGRAPAVAGLRAAAPDRVEIRLDFPQPAFLQRLATTGAYVLDRETLTAGGTFAPVGTGAFRLVAWSATEVRLAAYRDHYRGRPYLDEVRLVVDGPRPEVLRAFAGGRRAILRLQPHEVRDLTAGLGWTGPQWQVPLPATAWIEVNGRRPPLDRREVRLAVAYAMDRETLIAGLLPGGYSLAEGLIPPGVAGHGRAGRVLPPYRALSAREQLVRAGLTGGQSLRWLQPGELLWPSVAARADHLLGRVGLELTVETAGHADYLARTSSSRATYHLAPRSLWAEYLDPEALFLPLLARPGAPLAVGWVPEAHLRALVSATGRDRASAAGRLEGELLLTMQVLPLYHPVTVLAAQPWVRGLEPTPFPQGPDLWRVSLDPPGDAR